MIGCVNPFKCVSVCESATVPVIAGKWLSGISVLVLLIRVHSAISCKTDKNFSVPHHRRKPLSQMFWRPRTNHIVGKKKKKNCLN